MATMAIFAHLCENFVGVRPKVDMFCHYFVPRVESKVNRSGIISWMLRVARKIWDYLPGYQRERWDEWRGDWCWIQDKEAPEFREAWKECVERGKDWSAKGLTEDRLCPAIKRVTHLAAAGLTIEHVGADFLRHRIASLHRRDKFSWEYRDATDRMWLYPGRNDNLTVMSHAWLCK